ncbi:cysteine hydrolase [Cytobacillus sp. Sa5YUA1]|uniref:Cysteine hydrolase n=1 Tax=Cytobacillus stercorigallinarum TaxID=2762240 RepID=A0ABR8QT22_9BACI|nr:cysteine hydrolase family protein [Cytobacillus stercorigallinarum]MBD7938638.1 cysteine hydrolase [Cytobacillus stercorigallinarum]
MKQALLVIDVQNDYFQGGKMELYSPLAALKQINKLEDYFMEKKEPIIYMQHVMHQEGAPFFEVGTEGAQLHEGLNLTESSTVIEKVYPNSFRETNLAEILEKLAIEQLVITGMMTHMCVDSTARAANELGYDPIVLSDTTATLALTHENHTVPAQYVQNAFLAALSSFATVITVEEYLRSK